MGTSSWTLFFACSWSSDTGSGRSGPGSNVALSSRGTLARASLPLALHSASLLCGTSDSGRSASWIPLSSTILGHLPDTSPRHRPLRGYDRGHPPRAGGPSAPAGGTAPACPATGAGYPCGLSPPFCRVTMAEPRCGDEGRSVTVDRGDRSATDGSGPSVPAVPPPAATPTRRARVGALIGRLTDAIRRGDDKAVEQAVLQLSQRRRWLAPLALIVGAFLMLFQGVKLLYTNWRLAVIQIVPAMWIWIAMLDIKLHVLHGKQFHVIRGPVLIPCILGAIALAAASFYLNGVFAFTISVPGPPKIRPAFSRANRHIRSILAWGCSIGAALAFSALIATRWGHWPFVISQSIVVGIMMLCYIAVPARIVGVEKKAQSRRDVLAASAVGGAVGAVVCSPPYMLGRLGILMLGWPYVFWLGIILIVLGATLQTGATSAVKAVKFSAKLVGHPSEVVAEPSPG